MDGGQTDGRNLDPLVSLHLGGLDKNGVGGGNLMAITDSTWQLQDVQDCYKVYVAVMGST